MRLADWLEQTATTRTAIAEKLGVSRAFVSQLCLGRKTPSLSMALAIRDMTSGKVRPEDWRANAP